MARVSKVKKTNTKTEKKEIDNNVYYTILGDHEHLDKNGHPVTSNEKDNTCAKFKNSDDRPRFFIKVGLHGKIYNPIGMYSEGTAGKFLSRIGKQAWQYKEVNQKVFNMYLSFLKTKNIAWLNNAQRELS